MGAGRGRRRSAASYRSRRGPIPTTGARPRPMGWAPGRPDHGARISADAHPVMSRLPSLTFAGLTLLLAAGPAPADECRSPRRRRRRRIDRTAPSRPEPAPAVDATWRDPASPSPARPAKRWSTSAEVDSNSYRLSLSRGKLDLGVGFDAPPGPATKTARSVDPVGPIVPTLPSLSIGLRSATAGAPPNSLIERASATARPRRPPPGASAWNGSRCSRASSSVAAWACVSSATTRSR